MTRFFASPSCVSEGFITLSEEDTAHIRSLRLRPDELFVVCDGNCTDYICRLSDEETQKSSTVAKIVDMRTSRGEPSITCSVYIAFAKGDRLDYAVQKSVELGANDIVLYQSSRCVAVPHDIPKKAARLQKIALETAKQCGRGIIPVVSFAVSFEEAVAQAVKNTKLSLFFYEFEENLHIKEVLEKHFSPMRECEEYSIKSVSIMLGPEGGFAPNETEYAKSKGMYIVSLGPRILRCETAPVAALSALMYHTDNL